MQEAEHPVLQASGERRVTRSELCDTCGCVKGREEGRRAEAGVGGWSVGVSFPTMQVPEVDASTSEVGAATAQARPVGREWFFGGS